MKHHIQHMENTTPAVVISVEAAPVNNAILLDYLTSEVAQEETEIGSIDPNIPIDNKCRYDAVQCRMAGGNGNYKDDGDKSDKGDAICTACQRRRPTIKL